MAHGWKIPRESFVFNYFMRKLYFSYKDKDPANNNPDPNHDKSQIFSKTVMNIK